MRKFTQSKINLLIGLVFIMLFFGCGSLVAVTKTWSGGTGTNLNWTIPSNWSGNTVPALNDDVVFNTAGVITFNKMSVSVVYNSIAVNQGTITLADNSSTTLTIGGNAGTDFFIANGAALTIGTKVSIVLASNSTANINGLLTINANRDYNTNATGVVTTVTGTIINAGTVTGSTATNLLFQSGSTYQHAQDGGTIPIAKWDAASTCLITGITNATTLTGIGQNFGNITWNCPAQNANLYLESNISIAGNLTVKDTGTPVDHTNHSLRLSSTTFGYTMNVAGDVLIENNAAFKMNNGSGSCLMNIGRNLTINGGYFTIVTGTANSTVNVTGNVHVAGGNLILKEDPNTTTGTLNIAGNFTQSGGTIAILDIPNGTGIINFNGGDTQTFSKTAGTISNKINFAVNSGSTLDVGTSIIDGSTGTFTLSSGAGFITANTQGISTTSGIGSIQVTGTKIYNAGANYTYNGTAAQVTGNGLISANSLIISNTAGVTASNDISISTLLKVSAGTFTSSTYNLFLKGEFINNGIVTNSGSGTINFNGSTIQSMSGSGISNFYNLSISNTSVGGVMVNKNINTNNLSISNGSKLTISPAMCMNVSVNISNNAGSAGLVIKASDVATNGSLIFHNLVNSPVQATVEMYTKAYYNSNGPTGYKYKWQFFGIPLRTTLANPVLDGSYVRKMYEYGNSTPTRWVQLQNDSILTSFTGYEITQTLPKIITFAGVLENGNFSSGQLSYTSSSSFPGQHLIGNPYTAAIDIKKLTFGAQMELSVYLYNTGSYADWSANTAPGAGPGQYVVVPQNHAGEGAIPGQVPSMQAFLVKAYDSPTGATLDIPYSSVVQKNTDLQRAPTTKKSNSSDFVLTMIDVKGSRFADRVWIFTEPTCTHNFDNGWDGRKMFGSSLAPQLYSIEADGDYQINSVDDINNTELGFQVGEDTQYTLKFTQENIAMRYSGIYLVDLLDNTTIDVTQSGCEYSFMADSTTTPVKRFRIVTQHDTTTELENVTSNKLKVFSSQNIIFVHNKSGQKGDLMLYDLSGRCIQTLPFKADGITTLPMNLPTGSYVAIGTTKSEKISTTVLLP